MAKGQFSTGGLRSVIAASNNLNQMMNDRPEEVVRELTTMVAFVAANAGRGIARLPRRSDITSDRIRDLRMGMVLLQTGPSVSRLPSGFSQFPPEGLLPGFAGEQPFRQRLPAILGADIHDRKHAPHHL